ncbi:MAG: iron-containing alcohol dehydrogenase [Thermoleophilia bacterium]|nr:iron-containing alcohol dehydrogenase [Thermoleophilia bacterium]
MMASTDVIEIKVPYTLFGRGALARLGSVAQGLGAKNPLIVTDKGLTESGIIDMVRAGLVTAGLRSHVFDEVTAEAPFSMVLKLRDTILEGGYDLLIGVGGGSAMDATKAAGILAANPEGRIDELKSAGVLVTMAGKPPAKSVTTVLVPTTSGTGSEWSNIAIITSDPPDDRNYAVVSNLTIPDAVITDPDLTRGLPPRVVGDSGMDALTHAIGAYTSSRANAYADMCATTAIQLIGQSLRPAYANPAVCAEERYQLALAASLAMLAGWVAGNGTEHMMNHAFHQKHVAHSHGARVGLLLPYVMEHNLIAMPERFADIARLLGEKTEGLSVMGAAQRSVVAVRSLLSDLDIPQHLRDIGLTAADIPNVVREYMTYWKSPVDSMCARPAGEKEVTEIFLKAL